MKSYHIAEYIYNGREFRCTVRPVTSSYEWLEVSIEELVRPHWKFFRYRYHATRSFFTSDYPSIDEAVKTMLARTLQRENERDKAAKDFENFCRMA